MAAFVKYDITVGGRNLIAKGAAGKLISYTRIAVGDGELLQAQDPGTMTALVNEILSIGITSVELLGNGQVRVRGAFSNAALTVGFLYREIGLYATDPDSGLEVLYCYGNAVNQAEWIPPSGTSTAIEKIVNVVTTIGSAANVTAVIHSGTYLTIEDFNDAIGNYYTKSQVDAALSNKASLDTFDKVVSEQTSRRIVDVTANKTLALSDAGTLQRSTGSSAITIVIPLNADVALPIGTEIEIFQQGAGRVTLDFSTSGVSLQGTAILTLPLFQYRVALIRKIATNQWALDISFLRKPVVTSSSTGVSGGYTLALTDAGTIRYFTGTTTVPIIIPTNSSVPFPIGTEISFIRVATSKCTFAADSGVTLISTKTGRNMDVVGSVVELKKWDTNSWVISGDLVT